MNWQEKFDTWFPDGLAMTLIRDSGEEITFLTPRLVMVDENEWRLSTWFMAVCHTTKSIEDFDPEHPKPWADKLLIDDCDQTWRLNGHLMPQAIEDLRKDRETHPLLYGDSTESGPEEGGM